MTIDRRTLLRGLAASAGGWTSGCVHHTPSAPQYAAIDTHCHVYNATDIPIKGFVKNVAFGSNGAISDAIGTFLAAIMEACSLTASQESMEIDNGSIPILTLSKKDERDLFDGTVGDVADKLIAQSIYAQTAAQKDLLKMFDTFAGKRRGSYTGRDVAKGVRASGGQIAGVFHMAFLMTRHRMELVGRLAKLPEHYPAEAKLLMPAMLDIHLWLGQKKPYSPHADQIALMTKIAKKHGSDFGVHGWVSYCPWRQIKDANQFERVKYAVMEGGFIGVKIYPVMGFLPSGNEAASATEPYNCELENTVPGFGKLLDQNLDALFRWCESNGVPILSHCSFSIYPEMYNCIRTLAAANLYGLRAGPDKWADVLVKYPALRLNFGHIGGPWHIVPDHGVNPPPDGPWTKGVIEKLGSSALTGISADIADYAAVMGRNTKERGWREEELSQMDQWLTALARERVTYGSDWLMLSLEPHNERYYDKMRVEVPQRLHIGAKDFLGRNAARQYGIAAVGGQFPPARQRLEKFYRDNHLNRAILSSWD
jgi:predicted TIM-barrel fold metal-dependent hydrolase